MFCENCGAEFNNPNQKFCPNCGIALKKKIIFRYNDNLNEFEDLEVDNDVQFREFLDPDLILLFVDHKRERIWIWHGSNTTTRMKFIAAKLTPTIRDHYGIGYKITAVDEGNETLRFKITAGLEEGIDYDDMEKGSTYEEPQDDLELIQSLSREKILQILKEDETIKVSSVFLSHFHQKMGPIVFFSFPKKSLDKELSIKIANIMEQQSSEGFFTHTFENLKSMNYYFEIYSDWTLGNKELLMVSIILDQQISAENEEKLSKLCTKFAERLQSNEEIYTAFYINDLNSFDDNDKEIIVKNEALIKAWVNGLYWAIMEATTNKPYADTKLLIEETDEVEDENEDDDGGDFEFFAPFPTIPPGSPGAAGDAKQKVPLAVLEEETDHEPYCKYCGATLVKGESICHVCGNKID